MSTLHSEVYEAFRDIGASEDKAMKAATALSKRDDDIADIKGRLRVVEWMLGVVLALNLSIFVKLFLHL